ncbi:MAG: hypothetical protein UW78_C0025G0008 [Candidatus Azambacteria bacterium GW2011_GWA1_44_9]|uniref:Uncharacterized protein n=1 Tax=Candidatus Azambacteria bacterium GW2011_GWA1_44_9 TaxID=1618610 RepID=A0A0G1KB62_9BACT|nr:MAG: hypothetical protein UW78_C0025G0008 [Candidatus Azambacteria bacterium GW2011_GWA1_44_9]
MAERSGDAQLGRFNAQVEVQRAAVDLLAAQHKSFLVDLISAAKDNGLVPDQQFVYSGVLGSKKATYKLERAIVLGAETGRGYFLLQEDATIVSTASKAVYRVDKELNRPLWARPKTRLKVESRQFDARRKCDIEGAEYIKWAQVAARELLKLLEKVPFTLEF